MEEWRDIPGYEGLYQICIDTPEGRCRSLNYKGRNIVQELSYHHKKKDNRLYWTLYRDGKKITQQAARWIALAYPELVRNEYFDGACIDHIDTNPNNNRPENLRWVTYKENSNNPLTVKHREGMGMGRKLSEETKNKIAQSHINNKYRSKSVVQMTMDGCVIAVYPSTRQAERDTCVSQSHISKCCLGIKQTAGGFIWRYAEQV